MTHPGLYFACVFGALLGITFGLTLVARAMKWKPKPIKPAWAVLVICLADLVAGLVCSFFGRDIHILYWWLLGLPAAAVLFPLIFISTTLFVRLFNHTLYLIFFKPRNKG
jgi:hypothetical protein